MVIKKSITKSPLFSNTYYHNFIKKLQQYCENALQLYTKSVVLCTYKDFMFLLTKKIKMFLLLHFSTTYLN